MLDGTLQMQVGDERFRLEAGDCLMMRFDKPIVFENPSRRSVRYAVIISHASAAR